MVLSLHQRVSKPQAIQAFIPGAQPMSYCAGQFCVGGTSILCFLAVAEPTASALESRSHVRWVAPQVDYHPEDNLPWLPMPVADPEYSPPIRYDDARNWWKRGEPPPPKPPRKHHQLFLRKHDEEDFIYVGPAHLGSYSMSPKKKPEADFYLESPLPRQHWLHFGGFDGWSIDTNHLERKIHQGDLPAIQDLLAAMRRVEHSPMILTRYEEDSLHLFTNTSRGWLMYLRAPDDSGLYVRNQGELGDDKEHFSCVCGIDLEYPRHRTLPRDRAMQVILDFFQTGVLPDWCEWTEDQD
jgi:hypothetical protein